MRWTWQGRQLVKAEKDKTVTYTYDSEGIRTSKTVGSTTTKYLLNGTQILAQTTNGKTLSFFYDQQGNRVAMADGRNNFYYYIYNLQGDVIALADAATGKLAATYTYDAWGKCTVTNASGYTIGTQNPFRYRGYYYDTETSLYYLQSRYYDPEVGRFINADGQLNGGALGYNMFAYCENDPANGCDPYGNMVWWAAAALGGAATEVAFYLIGNALSGQKSTWGGAAKAALKGAVEGVAFGAIGKGIQAAGKAYKAAKATKAAKAAEAAEAAKVAKYTQGTPSEVGKIGERLAGIDPTAKQTIQINGRTRIPDAMSATTLTEVKNVKYISNTQQLRDYADYAKLTNRALELYVRPTTKVAKTVTEAGWQIKHLW